MILLADNDVLHKLAACDLLDETVAALGAVHDEVFVLATLQYRFRLADEAKGRKKLGDAVFQRLKSFCTRVRVLDQAPPSDELAIFAEVDDVDNGEAILFASSALYPECIVTTGDKRSLAAFAGHPPAQAAAARLKGRVVCFEQIMVRLFDHLGFEAVRTKVAAATEFDVVVGIAFGVGCSRPEAQVRQAFHSYIENLRGMTGGLLTP